MGLFSKAEAYLGVDIGAGGIKLVELHKTKGRPQLWTYGIANEEMDIHIERREKRADELIAEDRGEEDSAENKKKEGNIPSEPKDPRIEKYSGILKELLKKAKVTTQRATASLPVSYIFHTVLTLPFIEEKKRDEIVSAEIAKLLPRPVQEMQIVYQEVPQAEEIEKGKKPKYIRLLVTAAPKDLVAFYTAVFQKAGLQLEALETEAFALERSLVGRDKSTVMVVDIGSERTNFFIMDSGLPAIHRSIQVGGNRIDQIIEKQLGIKPELVGNIKRDISRIDLTGARLDLFEPVLEPIIKEIAYGFELYLKQLGNENKRPERIILTGGSAFFPPIINEIKKNFKHKVFVGDPWARVVYQQGLKSVLDEIGPRMAVAIGLAMRNIVQ